MLTDPFYSPDVKYSGSSTGVSRFTFAEGSYVSAALKIVSTLQSAGWTIVDSAPSEAVQTRSSTYFTAGSTSGTPRPMTPAECNTISGPLWTRANAAGLVFNSYNPGALIPSCPAGSGGLRWYPYGATTLDTATNLAAKLSETGFWNCSITNVVPDPGGYYEFTFVSTALAFEYDEIPIEVGAGQKRMRRGYYTLRSPELDGAWLEVKIETRVIGHFGAVIVWDTTGGMALCLTVTASGGGTPFETPFYPGDYSICANGHQLLIWPAAGNVPTRLTNFSLLVSQLDPPAEHATGGVGTLAISTDIGDQNIRLDHLRQTLHWAISLGCGYNGELNPNVYRAGKNGGYQKLSMLVRGTKNRSTVSLAGQPLIEAPYILLPPSPLAGPGPTIAGKLWDIVLISQGAAIDSEMVYDGDNWVCFSTGVPANEVGCSMWIKAGAN